MKKCFVIFLSIIFLASCQKDDNFSYHRSGNTGLSESVSIGTGTGASDASRANQRRRNVMLLYSAGFNSLATYLDEDIHELPEGFVPQYDERGGHILLVYSKLPRRNQYGRCIEDFTVPTESALFRLYTESGKVVQDTIKVWGTDVNACDPATVREVLQLTYDLFPAKGYGMVFTSHATGWLPAYFYADPSKFSGLTYNGGAVGASSLRRMARKVEEFPPIDPFPAVKSLGQDNIPGAPLEMDLDDFCSALPFRLDYLLIDACLSGCVEVAWQLRGKADVVGFSQTEILADGFDYKTIASRLLQDAPDPLAVCQDYFNSYDVRDGQMRSATISVVEPGKMEDLANLCETLFEKYRNKLYTMSDSNVQGYFRFGRHFFYDLKDVLVKAGITSEEEAALDAALAKCIKYKAATEQFLSIDINTACGLSMYLPSMGTEYLDGFYKARIAWNDATQLVK